MQLTPLCRIPQIDGHPLLIFSMTAAEILQVARIDRASRDAEGALQGFQRPALKEHIRLIGAYLDVPSSFLPNAVILGFCTETASLPDGGNLTLDLNAGPPGWVVDGQQRLLASLHSQLPDRRLLVCAFLTSRVAELKRHFVLVNSVKPLPPSFISEILPGLDSVPPRLTDRTAAALVVETLNYRQDSFLRGLVNQQTNPSGVICDTMLHRVVHESLRTGFLSNFEGSRDTLLSLGVWVISDFFRAVAATWPEAWHGHTPRTSRLLHGAGIVALGHVMEAVIAKTKATAADEFGPHLERLRGHTAWTEGTWVFRDGGRPWNSLQNVPGDYATLSRHLVEALCLPSTDAYAENNRDQACA